MIAKRRWGTLEEEGQACDKQAERIFGPDCTADGLDKVCANEMWLNLHESVDVVLTDDAQLLILAQR